MKALSSVFLSFSMAIQLGILLVALLSDSWDMVYLLATAYLFSCAFSFLSMVLDDVRGGVSYMFEFFMLFFIATPALIQIHSGVFPWFAMLQPSHICAAYGVLALSHLSYQIGSKYQLRSMALRQAKVVSESFSYQDATFYSKWAWGLALVATLLAIAAGPSNLLVGRFEREDSGFEGLTEQLLFMCRSLSLLAMVMLIFLVKYINTPNLKRKNIYAILIFIPLFLIINYFPALPRFVLFGLLLALSTAFIDYFQPRNKAMMAFASIFILFIIFPVIKSLGAGELNWSGITDRADVEIIASYLLRVDFDAFMQIASTLEYYMEDVGPIRYGVNFIGVALFFVPRGIWPSKPIDTGEIISTELGYLYTNVSSPLPVEALMGFGLLGPVIIFFLLARGITNIESYAKAGKTNIPLAPYFFIYSISMGFIVIILRGALNGVAPQFATAFLAFLIMMLVKSRIDRRIFSQ
jgi:hypothetical protein